MPADITFKDHGNTALKHLLSAEALLGGPSRLNHTTPQNTLLGQHSREQFRNCMEAGLQSALLAQTSSWLHRVLLSLIPLGFVRSVGSGSAAMLQSVETGKLVRSDA